MSSSSGAHTPSDSPVSTPSFLPLSWLALALTLSALLVMSWGLSHLDLPIVRFVRSLFNQYGVLDDLWLHRWSDWGDWIGKGEVLFSLSGLLLIIGFLVKHKGMKMAGWETAIAHAAAGLLGILLKYLIGRPRPKFSHGDNWIVSPSVESGLHSFPSGHSSAAFAVATVLAYRFPRIAWLAYGVAALVAVSRVVRGAHFPTDVGVGMALGIVVGALVSDDRGDRWRAILEGTFLGALGVSLLFAMLWVATHLPHVTWWAQSLFGMGLLMVCASGLLRVMGRLGKSPFPSWRTTSLMGKGLMGMGIAVSTGSGTIVLVAGILLLSYWILARTVHDLEPDETSEGISQWMAVMTEATLLLSGLCFALVLHGLTGRLPLL